LGQSRKMGGEGSGTGSQQENRLSELWRGEGKGKKREKIKTQTKNFASLRRMAPKKGEANTPELGKTG